MSWAGSEHCRLYFGLSAVGMARPGDAPRWSQVEGVDEGKKLLLAWLAEQRQAGWLRRKGIKVCLSGALVRPFLIPPTTGLRRWREFVQIAERLAPDATGLAGPCAVWLDAFGADGACLAVAVERTLVSSIVASTREARLRLLSIEPWWGRALNEALAKPVAPRLLVVEDSDAVTMLGGEHGKFSSAATYAPRPAAEQMQALVTRATMNAGIDAAAVIRASMPRHVAAAANAASKSEQAGFRAQFEAPA